MPRLDSPHWPIHRPAAISPARTHARERNRAHATHAPKLVSRHSAGAGGRERESVCTATAWTEESRTSAAFHPRPTRAFTGLRLRLRLPTRMRMRLRTRPGRLLRSPCATAVERRGKAGKARAPFPQTRRALLFLHWWKQKKMFGRSVI